MSDVFHTIKSVSEGLYKEKMSKFISFAVPVKTADEAKEVVKRYQNEYHDARHVCWAYMLGPQRAEWQSNDNGEPSGTAGKPILGQINSFGLTDVVVVVVRYFGGIKLGTSGLIVAYREAARLALEAADKVECHDMREIHITFPYIVMNEVMKIIKGGNLDILSQQFDNTCRISLSVRKSRYDEIVGRFEDVSGLTFDS